MMLSPTLKVLIAVDADGARRAYRQVREAVERSAPPPPPQPITD